MNVINLESEMTMASPSERTKNLETHIFARLQSLQDQIQFVNDKLQKNIKILSEKQSENRQLKEILTKLETNIGLTQNTQNSETLISSEGSCASCKLCNIF